MGVIGLQGMPMPCQQREREDAFRRAWALAQRNDGLPSSQRLMELVVDEVQPVSLG